MTASGLYFSKQAKDHWRRLKVRAIVRVHVDKSRFACVQVVWKCHNSRLNDLRNDRCIQALIKNDPFTLESGADPGSKQGGCT